MMFLLLQRSLVLAVAVDGSRVQMKQSLENHLNNECVQGAKNEADSVFCLIVKATCHCLQ